MPIDTKTSARWRLEADADNPAGSLFAGEFAVADIVCETTTTSGYCGTACTFSRTQVCC